MSDLNMNKETMQKICGMGCLSGVILIIIGSLIIPGTNDISNIKEMQRAYGDNPALLQLSALFLVFGFWGLFVGVIGIQDSIDGSGAAWAKIGFYFNLIGTTIWTIGMSLDISYPAAIVNWQSSSEAMEQVNYGVVTVLSPLGFGRGLFPIEVITIWLSYILISIGILQCKNRPNWQGYIGLIIGLMGIIMGVIMVFTGREKLLFLYVLIMLFVLVWFFVIGIWTLREVRLSKMEVRDK